MGLFPLDQFPSFDVKKLDKQYQQQLENPPALTHRTATTPQAKLAAAKRLANAVPQGNLFADSEFAAPNYRDYEYYGQGYPTTPAVDTHKMAIAVNKTALPNLNTKIHQLQVIGPQVFGIMQARGTNTGPFLGIPATGRKIAIDLFEYWHFNKKGQVDVHNGIADLFTLIAQMGFVPPSSVPVYSAEKVDPKFLPELRKG
jgi:predicted ester cyclase